MSIRDFLRETVMFLIDRVDWIKTIVCMGVVSVFCFTSFTLAYVDIPEHNRDVFNHFTGIIDAAMMAVVGYYFGSSKSSQRKDETIKAQTGK